MIASVWSCILGSAATAIPSPPMRIDPVVPSRSGPASRPRAVSARPATLFINFDGGWIGSCKPADSRRNCSELGGERAIPAFSGSAQQRLAIVEAVRRQLEDLGVRVTSQRPDVDQNYTMVMYGGSVDTFGDLGLAPPPDCDNQRPNEIAFAHVDAELAGWVAGGATVVLHEAAHTWGLDHVDDAADAMFPSSTDRAASFHGECASVVADTALTRTASSCPDVNEAVCGDPDLQDGHQILRRLLGPAYVDVTTPRLDVLSPDLAHTYAAPADLDIELSIEDDSHPQRYALTAWLEGDPRPETPTLTPTPGLSLIGLGAGTWTLHIEVADEAGNQARERFDIEVSESPAAPDGGCRVVPPSGTPGSPWSWALVALGTRRRRRRRRTLAACGAAMLLSCTAEVVPAPTGGRPTGSDPIASSPRPDPASELRRSPPASAVRPPPARGLGSGLPDETNGVCRLYAPELAEPECCEVQTGFDVPTVLDACDLASYLGESFQYSCGYHFLTKSVERAWFRVSFVRGDGPLEAARRHASELTSRMGEPTVPEPLAGVAGGFVVSYQDRHWAFVPGWDRVRQVSWTDRACDADAMLRVLATLRHAPSREGRPPPRTGLLPTARASVHDPGPTGPGAG